MLLDPLRYIQTTRDGLVTNYDNLPANVSSTTELVYENNPFSQSTLTSLELTQSNGAPAQVPMTTKNLDSYSNLLQTAPANCVEEYDDVIVPQADTFERVNKLKLLF